jgi:hypothetical protein
LRPLTDSNRRPPLYDIPRDRRDGVLQLGQLGDVLRGQEIGPRREGLAELDERRSEFLEREPNVLGT